MTAVLVSCAAAGVAAISWAWGGSADPLVQISEAEAYGLASAGFLYLTLLISPLSQALPRLPFKRELFLARRGLGLSSVVFLVPHTWVSWSGPLGGWPGLRFLDQVSGLALILGLAALLILLLLASTAWDGAQRRLGPRLWKRVHRGIYVAGTLAVAHIFLLGPHYVDGRSAWTDLTMLLCLALLLLQAGRLDRWYQSRFPQRRRWGPASVLLVMTSASLGAWLVSLSWWALWPLGLVGAALVFPVLQFDRWWLESVPDGRSFGHATVAALALVCVVLFTTLNPAVSLSGADAHSAMFGPAKGPSP